METTARVTSPPARPLMVYDGDCGFCRRWVRRWQGATGEKVDYAPFQDAESTMKFPEIPREQFEASVQLILPDGTVLSGAEAVFQSLAFNPRRRFWLKLYRRRQFFARLSESLYSFVARHREFLTRWTP